MKLFKELQIIVLICIQSNEWKIVCGACEPLIPNEYQNVQVTCLVSSVPCKTSGADIPNGSQAEIKCLDNYETGDSTNGNHVLTCDWGRWVGQSLFNEMRCKIKCGRPAVENVGQVINGTKTERLKWPWHVALFRNDIYICGGSIVNPIGDALFILTAVHCTISSDGSPVDTNRFKVVIGAVSSNLNENLNTANTQILQVREIIRHENYDLQRHLEDITLIQTDKPIQITPFSLPICLPTNEIMVSSQLKAKSTFGTVVGFGTTEGPRKVASEKLNEVTLPVVSTEDCHDLLDQRPTSSQMCAGTPEGVNTCSGDSGGGFVFKTDYPIRYTIQGIVSSAPQEFGCKGFSIFTKVFSYMRWIRLESDKLIFAGGKGKGTIISMTSQRRTTTPTTTTIQPAYYKMKDFEYAAVRLHNKYRKKHDAEDVSIDPELSLKAQKLADHLIQTNAKIRHEYHNSNGTENMSEFRAGTGTLSRVQAMVEIMDHWYNSNQYYRPYDPRPSPFTRIVWKSSKKIGAGISSDGRRMIVVVTYSPPGNTEVNGDKGKSYNENVTVEF